MFVQGLGLGIGFSVGVGLMVFGFMVVYTLALIFTRLPYVRDVIAYLKPLEDPEWEKEYDKFQKDCVSLVRQLTRLNEKSAELDANVGDNADAGCIRDDTRPVDRNILGTDADPA